MAYVTKLQSYIQEHHTGKTIIIFGCAEEGFSTYQFLRSMLPETHIYATDDKPLEALSEAFQKAVQNDSALSFFSPTELPLSKKTTHILYKTPGIAPTHQFFARLSAETNSIQQTSNTNLFLQLINEIPAEDRPHTIGITGTKGKSTTSAVLAHILQTADKQVLLAGNIGTPALNLMEKIYFFAQHEMRDAFIVLELSSHQILDLAVSPHTAIIQDITPEHLDYYHSFDKYWGAKARLVAFQNAEDVVMYNPSYTIPTQIAGKSQAEKVLFSLDETVPTLVMVKDETIYTRNGEEIVNVSELQLVGSHNLLNILPGITFALRAHIRPAIIRIGLKTFSPLPHRLNFVAEREGVRYYNDSQATTPEATCAALESFKKTDIVLIAGGSDKGVQFEELSHQILSHSVKALLLFPPMGAVIKETLISVAQKESVSIPPCIEVASMAEAVSRAREYAEPGDVVLLSPACASFGIFKNYKDRGNQFVAHVQEISATKPA